MGGGCLQSSASKGKRGNYEKMCPMSRKTRIRRPLPYFLERTLVGTHSLLFGSLRRGSGTAVLEYFQDKMPYGLAVPDVPRTISRAFYWPKAL
jgi:hypothetical protein